MTAGEGFGHDDGLSLSATLVGAGLLWAAVAALDPERPAGILLGPLLAAAGLAVDTLRRREWRRLVFPALLTVAFAGAARSGPEFRADSGGYYAYLRSAAFDRDLDFANEWRAFGYLEQPPTATGLQPNLYSVGPAILWSPFFAAAHVYVTVDRSIGEGRHPANGLSPPYRRSPALGTLAIMLLGATLLFRTISDRVGPGASLLAVAGTILTSPLLYYAFVVPTMAHGVTFGVAAALVWAWDRARRAPSLGTWSILGALLGLVTLTRWQAAVYVLMVAPLALRGLRDRTARPAWLAAAGGAALLAVSPQLLAWRILFGRFFTMPQGAGYVDWSSPHMLDTLLSADHGLWTWTPAMALGFLGLIVGLRSAPLLHGSALLVFLATAWVNGGVHDWAGSDAFGARRFDLVLPLMALGLGTLLKAVTPRLARSPLLAPATLLLLLALWNLAFIARFREDKYLEAAPFDRLASDQARAVRHASQDVLGWLAGSRGRALAYRVFSAEYFYTRFYPTGTIELPRADDLLVSGWSAPRRPAGEPGFRWALYPEACVRVPLEEPIDLQATLDLRAPRQAQPQTIAVTLNGREVMASTPLGTEWAEVPLAIEAGALVPGENLVCLRFGNAARGGEGGSVAAAVHEIRLRPRPR